MELSTEDVRPRVKQGMQWLDENYGLHWRESIDLDTLYLWDPLYCVIGQLYGGFHRTMYMFDTHNDLVEHGFTLYSDEFCYDNWDVLQEAWEQVLS